MEWGNSTARSHNICPGISSFQPKAVRLETLTKARYAIAAGLPGDRRICPGGIAGVTDQGRAANLQEQCLGFLARRPDLVDEGLRNGASPRVGLDKVKQSSFGLAVMGDQPAGFLFRALAVGCRLHQPA